MLFRDFATILPRFYQDFATSIPFPVCEPCTLNRTKPDPSFQGSARHIQPLASKSFLHNHQWQCSQSPFIRLVTNMAEVPISESPSRASQKFSKLSLWVFYRVFCQKIFDHHLNLLGTEIVQAVTFSVNSSCTVKSHVMLK